MRGGRRQGAGRPAGSGWRPAMAASGNTVLHSPKGRFAVTSRLSALVSGSDQFKQRAGFSLIAVNVAQIIENNQVILVELVDGAFQ